MRTLRIVLAAVVVAGLASCSPAVAWIYRISVDMSGTQGLPASCYKNNQTPFDKTTLTGITEEYEWVIWPGMDGNNYLDMGRQTWDIGQAEQIKVGELLLGKDKTFEGTRVEQQLANPAAGNPTYSNQTDSKVTVTFDELGGAAKGTIKLLSKYSCTSCTIGQGGDNKVATCEASLKFEGRRIDTQAVAQYSPQL